MKLIFQVAFGIILAGIIVSACSCVGCASCVMAPVILNQTK